MQMLKNKIFDYIIRVENDEEQSGLKARAKFLIADILAHIVHYA